MSNEKPRTVYLDLLRVLAMTGVICIHVSGNQFYNLPVHSPAWQAMNLWDGLARWAVPMFAMVSGAVFLDPQRRISERSIFQKYIPRLILAFLVWSALYAAVHCQGSPRVFFTRLLRGHYHLWYLYMLAGFYLIVPILRRITASERLTWYFLALSAVFTFGVPDLILFAKFADRIWDFGLADIFNTIKQYTMFFLTLGFVPYFVLGHALHQRQLSKRETIMLCVLGLLGFVLTPFLNALVSAMNGAPQEEFLAYSKFCVLFQTAGVFAAAKAVSPRLSGRMQRRILSAAACSFGVYLVHPLLLDRFAPVGALTHGAWAFLAVPVTVLVLTVLSLVLSALIRCIPWIGKRIA